MQAAAALDSVSNDRQHCQHAQAKAHNRDVRGEAQRHLQEVAQEGLLDVEQVQVDEGAVRVQAMFPAMPEVKPISDSWKSRTKDSLMLFFAMSEVKPSAVSWKLRKKDSSTLNKCKLTKEPCSCKLQPPLTAKQRPATLQ